MGVLKPNHVVVDQRRYVARQVVGPLQHPHNSPERRSVEGLKLDVRSLCSKSREERKIERFQGSDAIGESAVEVEKEAFNHI